jgi:RecG-like helicase
MNIQKTFLLLVCFLSYSIKPQSCEKLQKRIVSAEADFNNHRYQIHHVSKQVSSRVEDSFQDVYPILKKEHLKQLEELEKEMSICNCDYVDATGPVSYEQWSRCNTLLKIRISLLRDLKGFREVKDRESLKN